MIPNTPSRFRSWLLVLDGILVALLCVVLLAIFVPQLYERFTSRSRPRTGPIVGSASTEAAERGVAVQDIHISPPRWIERSGTWVIQVDQRDLESEKSIATSRTQYFRSRPTNAYVGPPEFRGIRGRATVNLIFFTDADSSGYLLFEKSVLIRGVYLSLESADPQDYILYDVVDTDSDDDGRLTHDDEAGLWISDLSGRDLRRITPEDLALSSFSYSADKRQVFVVGWEINPEISLEHRDQSLHVYDTITRRLERVPIETSLIERARSLLQR